MQHTPPEPIFEIWACNSINLTCAVKSQSSNVPNTSAKTFLLAVIFYWVGWRCQSFLFAWRPQSRISAQEPSLPAWLGALTDRTCSTWERWAKSPHSPVGQHFSDISALISSWETRLELPLRKLYGSLPCSGMLGEILLNDSSKSLLSPTELQMNSVLLTWGKKPCKIWKAGKQSFFLTLHSYKKVVLIFTSVSYYLMFLFEHVTKTIQSSPAFCHWLVWETINSLVLSVPTFVDSCSNTFPVFFRIFRSNCFQTYTSCCSDSLFHIF